MRALGWLRCLLLLFSEPSRGKPRISWECDQESMRGGVGKWAGAEGAHSVWQPREERASRTGDHRLGALETPTLLKAMKCQRVYRSSIRELVCGEDLGQSRGGPGLGLLGPVSSPSPVLCGCSLMPTEPTSFHGSSTVQTSLHVVAQMQRFP